MAMHQVLAQSISMCDVDVRPNLYSNIVLAGGTTLVQVIISLRGKIKLGT